MRKKLSAMDEGTVDGEEEGGVRVPATGMGASFIALAACGASLDS
jgi:hypothetical protein